MHVSRKTNTAADGITNLARETVPHPRFHLYLAVLVLLGLLIIKLLS